MSKIFFVLICLWLGMVIGVSFIATPAKFLATNLTLPVAIIVGHVIFCVYFRIE